jgi:phage-related protein
VIEFLLAGSRHELHFIDTGSNLLVDFADQLKATGKIAAVVREDPSLGSRSVSPANWKKFLAAAKRIAQHGYRALAKTNVVKTWREGEDPDGTPIEVCEIRKGQVRVMFFEDQHTKVKRRSRLILTHGFIKKTDETPKEEVNHFKNLRADYYTWLLGDE